MQITPPTLLPQTPPANVIPAQPFLPQSWLMVKISQLLDYCESLQSQIHAIYKSTQTNNKNNNQPTHPRDQPAARIIFTESFSAYAAIPASNHVLGQPPISYLQPWASLLTTRAGPVFAVDPSFSTVSTVSTLVTTQYALPVLQPLLLKTYYETSTSNSVTSPAYPAIQASFQMSSPTVFLSARSAIIIALYYLLNHIIFAVVARFNYFDYWSNITISTIAYPYSKDYVLQYPHHAKDFPDIKVDAGHFDSSHRR
jgi:hypothetical protein